ncbi:hypothetical protein Vadar_019605 [Vaccinium darrowii]|uniref:Uncharacterized protein n=1 Tax=Vaccinium darrowii TaxID=229202 RepID=A0ACB7XS39_9ERIC|nr:hypothetical protein Vadar_019605 [Vaccinium darrowii]
MAQKLIFHSLYSPSIYSVAYEAPDHTLAELERPCESRVDILGSFNGILLLLMNDVELYLWNPSIRMFRKFSPPEPSGTSFYGLGYDSVTEDFKVVRILWALNNDPCPVHVFSSKLSLWKSIGTFSYYFPDDVPGMVLNGAPHWIVGSAIDINRERVLFHLMAALALEGTANLIKMEEEEIKGNGLPTGDFTVGFLQSLEVFQ